MSLPLRNCPITPPAGTALSAGVSTYSLFRPAHDHYEKQPGTADNKNESVRSKSSHDWVRERYRTTDAFTRGSKVVTEAFHARI